MMANPIEGFDFSIEDMAKILEKQQLMSKTEAVPAIRSFLTKMYDDSQRQSGF